jgi:hypothetical protein
MGKSSNEGILCEVFRNRRISDDPQAAVINGLAVSPKQFGKNRYVPRRPKKSDQDFIVVFHHPATPSVNYTPLWGSFQTCRARTLTEELMNPFPKKILGEIDAHPGRYCRRPQPVVI